ncbi:MAG: hypothetical protein HKN16_06550, partial [Saprospiraceae bacterium]|nr:hypothetical protein [Saprospiraceae bacterium]
MKHLLPFLLFSIFFISCQPKETQVADAKPEIPVREPGEVIYPPISLDEMQALAQNTT